MSTYLTVSFAGGRTEQISLPAPVVTPAQVCVADYQAWRGTIEAVSAINRERLRRAGEPQSGACPRPERRARAP